ncbi:MAG: HAD-IIB family hydrolase [Pseudomonadota bacterium]
MTTVYLFDVDGTLTFPRMPMREDFAEFFYNFCTANLVYLVSGSDYTKLQEQVPRHILNKCRGVFSCSGAEYREKGFEVYSRRHQFTNRIMKKCQDFVDNSTYTFPVGVHVEKRPGLLNVSSVGRNACPAERKAYHVWDHIHKERVKFVNEINATEPDYEASIGGEISIDIAPKGWNKSVVKRHVLEQHPAASLFFMGDRILPGGNDNPLAEALDDGTGLHSSFCVSGYAETWRMLETRGVERQLRVA